MIRVQDIGEVAYGGIVTFTEWWDNKRVEDNRIKNSEVLKKAGFYAYLLIGLFATLASAFGWWRRQEKWMEHISHGFLYDFPRFIKNIVTTMRSSGTTGAGDDSIAVKQAKEILRRRQQELAGRGTRALGQGAEGVTPGEVPIVEEMQILA
jgi:hypothetical protein